MNGDGRDDRRRLLPLLHPLLHVLGHQVHEQRGGDAGNDEARDEKDVRLARDLFEVFVSRADLDRHVGACTIAEKIEELRSCCREEAEVGLIEDAFGRNQQDVGPPDGVSPFISEELSLRPSRRRLSRLFHADTDAGWVVHHFAVRSASASIILRIAF